MKRFLTTLVFVVTALFATGCATSQAEMTHNETMYDKQIAATQKATPTPIFQMVAIPGQTITLSGVERFSVYNPADTTGKVPEYKAPPNVTVELAKIIVPSAERFGLGWLGTVLGITNATKGAADKDVASSALTSITPIAPWATPVQ